MQGNNKNLTFIKDGQERNDLFTGIRRRSLSTPSYLSSAAHGVG